MKQVNFEGDNTNTNTIIDSAFQHVSGRGRLHPNSSEINIGYSYNVPQTYPSQVYNSLLYRKPSIRKRSSQQLLFSGIYRGGSIRE